LIAEPASDPLTKNSLGALLDETRQEYPFALPKNLGRAVRVSPHPKLSQRFSLGGGLSQELLNKGSGSPRIFLDRVLEESNSVHGGAVPFF
jgi:hypothetical protein